MVDFSLSEDQQQFIDLARKFVADEFIPRAAELDEKSEFPRDIYVKLQELGLMHLGIPEVAGGLGLPLLDRCMIIEEFGFGCSGIGLSAMIGDLALGPIYLCGNEEIQKRLLTPFTQELRFGAFALTEPSSGSDPASLKMTAEDQGDHWLINGEKMWITNGSVADLYTTFATVDPSLGHKGIIALAVDRHTEGVKPGKHEDKLGQRASDTSGIHFENVKVPKENTLAGPGEGFKLALRTLDESRPLVAALATGVLRRALHESARYSTERVQFGQPIGKFQAIQHKLANMAVDLEASRLLVHKAAWLHDQGLPSSQNSSMAKLYSSEAVMRNSIEAVQVFGGYGYSREFPVEKLMRDAKIFELYEGTSEIQRLVIAKHVLKPLWQ